MEYRISPTLTVVGTSKRRSTNCAKFQIWAKNYGLSDEESMCCFLYNIYKDNIEAFPLYSVSYQDFLKSAREGFEKLKAYKESTVNV